MCVTITNDGDAVVRIRSMDFWNKDERDEAEQYEVNEMDGEVVNIHPGETHSLEFNERTVFFMDIHEVVLTNEDNLFGVVFIEKNGTIRQPTKKEIVAAKC